MTKQTKSAGLLVSNFLRSNAQVKNDRARIILSAIQTKTENVLQRYYLSLAKLKMDLVEMSDMNPTSVLQTKFEVNSDDFVNKLDVLCEEELAIETKYNKLCEKFELLFGFKFKPQTVLDLDQYVEETQEANA